LAFAAAADVVLFKRVLDNWGKSKPPPYSARSSAANQSGQRAAESSKYDSKGPGGGSDPAAPDGAAGGNIPSTPQPDGGVVAPFTTGEHLPTAPPVAMPPQGYSGRLSTENFLMELKKQGKLAGIQFGTQVIQSQIEALAKKYGLHPGTTYEWVRNQSGSEGPGSSGDGKSDDMEDVDLDMNNDDGGGGSITHEEAKQRQPALEQQPSVPGAVGGQASQPALPRPPPPTEKKINVDATPAPSQGGLGAVAAPQTGQIRQSYVVFVDRKGKPFVVNPPSGGRFDPTGTAPDGQHSLGGNLQNIQYLDMKTTKFGDKTYYQLPDGSWALGVTRDPANVANSTKNVGIRSETGGLAGSYNIDKLDRSKAMVKLQPDEKKGVVTGYQTGTTQQRSARQGGQPINQPAVNQPGVGRGVARPVEAKGDDKKGDVKGGGGAGGPVAADDTQPPLAVPVGGQVDKSQQQKYETPQERKDRLKKEQDDFVPPELQGLVKKLTTPQPQQRPTGDETLGQKGQTGLLRPEFIEGGANFVGEVNKDVTLNLIQELGWQGFNNYQWESNEQGDNPLYLQELAQTGERFSGILFGDEYIGDQEVEARYATHHIDPKINAFRDVPDTIQQQARNIFMAVVPYEGQAAMSDSNQTQFKSSVLTNYEFHNVYLPDGFHFPSSGPLEKFTEADGTQYPDSARLLGYELSLHDAEPLSNVNNWIATTST
jgi:hypothetical protein